MSGERPVTAAIREGAARLSALFGEDRALAEQLNAAQRTLRAANDRLTAGLTPAALQAVYGPSGPDLGLSGRRPAVLEADSPIAALEEVADAIRGAFVEYQRVAEDRRQLAMTVEQADTAFRTAMLAAGFTADEASRADVHALASSVLRIEPRR